MDRKYDIIVVSEDSLLNAIKKLADESEKRYCEGWQLKGEPIISSLKSKSNQFVVIQAIIR